MGGWHTFGIALMVGLSVVLGILAWNALRNWRNPGAEPIEAGISDSLQIEKILYRMGLVNVDLSRCIETETIGGRIRVVSFYLDGRQLPGFRRKRTLSERWGKRTVILSGISNLTELRDIRLANVGVYQLPEEIGRLKKLEYLQVANGRLTSLPDSLGEASALESLWLQDNLIATLPASICSLGKINTIMVSGNPRIRFPRETCLEALKTLYIDRSQINQVPEYLRNRIKFSGGKPD